MDKNPILGFGDSDIPLKGLFLKRSWEAALIDANARLISLKGSFPEKANPTALIYKGDDKMAYYVYFDSAHPEGKKSAINEVPEDERDNIKFTQPLYIR